eukprot:scaffold60391_cov35-Tisochrysis_lutea.AAC.3
MSWEVGGGKVTTIRVERRQQGRALVLEQRLTVTVDASRALAGKWCLSSSPSAMPYLLSEASRMRCCAACSVASSASELGPGVVEAVDKRDAWRNLQIGDVSLHAIDRMDKGADGISMGDDEHPLPFAQVVRDLPYPHRVAAHDDVAERLTARHCNRRKALVLLLPPQVARVAHGAVRVIDGIVRRCGGERASP